MTDLAAIVARDADVPWSAALAPLHVTDEYVWTALDDRRALLALLRETRDAASEYLAHDGSGIKRQDRWAGDFDAFQVHDARERLRTALAALAPVVSA